MKKTIGITGYAGVGKDTLAEIIISVLADHGKTGQRFSFADILKEELQPLMLQHGIDPLNCSREDKELIRNILVEYGLFLRNRTNGRYLIEKLEQQISGSSCDCAIITDVRYLQYEHDEFQWLIEELAGSAIILKRWKPKTKGMERSLLFEAANMHEYDNAQRIQTYINDNYKLSDRFKFITWDSFISPEKEKQDWKGIMSSYYLDYILPKSV